MYFHISCTGSDHVRTLGSSYTFDTVLINNVHDYTLRIEDLFWT
jgi:hypothetical protein